MCMRVLSTGWMGWLRLQRGRRRCWRDFSTGRIWGWQGDNALEAAVNTVSACVTFRFLYPQATSTYTHISSMIYSRAKLVCIFQTKDVHSRKGENLELLRSKARFTLKRVEKMYIITMWGRYWQKIKNSTELTDRLNKSYEFCEIERIDPKLVYFNKQTSVFFCKCRIGTIFSIELITENVFGNGTPQPRQTIVVEIIA